MIWADFVRDATPEEMENAPGAATPAGQTKKEFQSHYETRKKKSQGYWLGIGADRGTIVDDENAYDYALERSLHGSPEDQNEFREMLVEWFYSGNWVRRDEDAENL